MRAELSDLPEQIRAQENQSQALQTQYDVAAEESLSLSPNLTVENIGLVQVEKLRSSAILALVGAFLGMLAWLMAQLVTVGRRAAARSQTRLDGSAA
jgi:preprotein translocase subunit SecF